MIIKLDKEYEVKCTLGTIKDIERTFNKSFFELVKNLSTMRSDEHIKLLYLGVKRGGDSIKESEFIEKCEESLGIGDLMEIMEKYLYALQYPGMTEEEVQDKVAKKLEKSREAKALIG